MMNAILKYPGAKWRIADWIVGKIPKHHSYLEPFFGSGAILFRKNRSNIETVNDLDGDIVNLFRVVREKPGELASAVHLTPYARQEYDDAFKSSENVSDVERARKMLVKHWQGHGFRTGAYKAGWKNDLQGRERSYVTLCWNRVPTWIKEAAERLKDVQIEHSPALEVIERFNFPNVLIYADPPYVLSTRTGKNYTHEMTDADHEKLLKTLLQHKGMVMLSGYHSELYDDYLSDWYREEVKTFAEHARPRTEVLWMNFAPSRQVSIYDMGL